MNGEHNLPRLDQGLPSLELAVVVVGLEVDEIPATERDTYTAHSAEIGFKVLERFERLASELRARLDARGHLTRTERAQLRMVERVVTQ